jgi:hypothetical protein
VNSSALVPRRHEPPPGWPADVFEAVTDALATALAAAYRRRDDATAELSR